MIELYLPLWPVAASCIFLALLAASSIARRRGHWLALTLAAVVFSLALYAPRVLAKASDPKNNMLARDVAGALFLATVLPLVAGWLGARLAAAGRSPVLRSLAILVLSAICLGVSPLYFLIVHCTSGDCL